MMRADVTSLIGSQIVIRCGNIQPDRSLCGRRRASWTMEAAPAEPGGWRLVERMPTGHEEDRVRGQRVSYRCHPKRCGAKYDLRLTTLTAKILEGMEAGYTELWVSNERTEWWLA
jgi:hypothetical protein